MSPSRVVLAHAFFLFKREFLDWGVQETGQRKPFQSPLNGIVFGRVDIVIPVREFIEAGTHIPPPNIALTSSLSL